MAFERGQWVRPRARPHKECLVRAVWFAADTKEFQVEVTEYGAVPMNYSAAAHHFESLPSPIRRLAPPTA